MCVYIYIYIYVYIYISLSLSLSIYIYIYTAPTLGGDLRGGASVRVRTRARQANNNDTTTTTTTTNNNNNHDNNIKLIIMIMLLHVPCNSDPRRDEKALGQLQFICKYIYISVGRFILNYIQYVHMIVCYSMLQYTLCCSRSPVGDSMLYLVVLFRSLARTYIM